MARFIFAGLLLFVHLTAYTQQPGIYPLPFVKFTDNYTFDNPAASSLSDSWEVKLLNSFYTGLLNNVGFYYFDASLRINQKNTNVHTAGLMIYSEYETEILKRTRVYGRYAWSSLLTPALNLSAGIHAGFFNYSVKSTGSSSGASSLVPDVNLGLWLKGKKFNIGISSAQITGSEVKPVNTIFTLSRYFVLTSDYSFLFSSSSKLTLAGKAWKGQGNNEGLHTAARVVIFKNFSAEINYLVARGAGFSLGVLEFPLLKMHGDLYFSYFEPMGRYNAYNAQRMEISLKLYK